MRQTFPTVQYRYSSLRIRYALNWKMSNKAPKVEMLVAALAVLVDNYRSDTLRV